MASEITVLSLLAALMIFNCCASYMAIRSSYFSGAQKIFQILFVWLVPVLGAVTVSYFSKERFPVPRRGSPTQDGLDNVSKAHWAGSSGYRK